MRILKPRKDFIIVEEYFSPEQAAEWLARILKLGADEYRGFHHPDLKPNRFHSNPKYPVKKFMCLGLYWSPMDYSYQHTIADTAIKPHPIPLTLKALVQDILKEFFPYKNFSPEAVLVNFYTQDSSMGLHIDKDEEDHQAPVIGLNFGSACRFFYESEAGEIKDVRIPGNSIYIFGSTARLMRHGVGTVYAKTLSPGSEKFLQSKERLNITIRQVFASADKS
jgi:DNA alkylation damage repair protein AlkB